MSCKTTVQVVLPLPATLLWVGGGIVVLAGAKSKDTNESVTNESVCQNVRPMIWMPLTFSPVSRLV